MSDTTQQQQKKPAENQLLRTGEDLIECLRTNPRRIAEAMGRLHRFGGQVEGCTVLAHSLRVYDDTLGQSPRTRLWALLHDVHEVLTGEVVRTHKGHKLRTFQTQVDWYLMSAFCPDITEAEKRAVRDADDATNRREYKRWQTGGAWQDADNVRLWLEAVIDELAEAIMEEDDDTGRMVASESGIAGVTEAYNTPPVSVAGGFSEAHNTGDRTMATQYAVMDTGSCEILAGWVDTEAEANTLAEEIERHESEPECRVITREVRLLKLIDTRCANAEIVVAYDTTTQEIVDIVTVDGQVACADVLRIQAAVLRPQPVSDEGVQVIEYVYREAGLTRQPGGVVVSIQDGRYHVADDHHGEYYDTVGEAVADLESWRS